MSTNDHSDEALFYQRLEAGQRYWQSARGTRQWRAEKRCLSESLDRLGGQQGLELGIAPTLLAQTGIRHCMRWAPAPAWAAHASTLVAHPDALPLEDGALDLVVLHHLLEIAPRPRHLLREAARVTADSGRLIVMGFHPYGIAGPRRLLAYPRNNHHSGDWLSVRRLRDWLGFVDFEIERIDYCGYLPFENTPEWLAMERWGRRYNLPLGRAWMIRARRQTLQMIPLKKRLHPRDILGARAGGFAGASCCLPPDDRNRQGGNRESWGPG